MRYTPPNQRNRSLNRRKSSERDRTNQQCGNGTDKTASRNVSLADYGNGVGRSNMITVRENTHPALVAIQGCCSSEAFQLLSERWSAAMHHFKDPSIDLSERPVLYAGSVASAWEHSRLPHQQTVAATKTGSSDLQMDFLSKLQRATQSSGASFDA